jgi:hypothetical protein
MALDNYFRDDDFWAELCITMSAPEWECIGNASALLVYTAVFIASVKIKSVSISNSATS